MTGCAFPNFSGSRVGRAPRYRPPVQQTGIVQTVTFGSASLLMEGMPRDRARAVLEAAVAAGAPRLDTAPMYGHGDTEGLVAEVAAAHPGVAVTTKVGIEPAPPPPRWRSVAAAVLSSLPGPLQERARRAAGLAQAPLDQPSGRFGLEAVRASVERSLARLGPLDRLLLHEVHPADVTDDLLALLQGYQERGDVASLGVATQNEVTAEALARGGGLLTVAHVTVSSLGPGLPVLPDGVHVVGHGVLGAGGADLRRARAALAADARLGRRWEEATAGTAHAGAGGLALALLDRARALPVPELLVATTRAERVAPTLAAASGLAPLSARASEVLGDVLAAAGSPGWPSPGRSSTA